MVRESKTTEELIMERVEWAREADRRLHEAREREDAANRAIAEAHTRAAQASQERSVIMFAREHAKEALVAAASGKRMRKLDSCGAPIEGTEWLPPWIEQEKSE